MEIGRRIAKVMPLDLVNRPLIHQLWLLRALHTVFISGLTRYSEQC